MTTTHTLSGFFFEQISAKKDIRLERQERYKGEADDLRKELTPVLQRAMDLARDKGASSW